jgi:TonB family protein
MYFIKGPIFALLMALAALSLQPAIASAQAFRGPHVPMSSGSKRAVKKQYVPDSKWVVDFDDQRCIASRRFRSESETMIFGISPWQIFDWVKIVIERPGNAVGVVPVRGWISIDGRKAHEVAIVAADSADVGRVVYTFSLPDGAFDEFRAAQRLRVKTRQFDAEIPLASMTPVVAKLGECFSLLLEHWGHSKEQQAAQTSYPSRKGRPVTSTDYPRTAIKRGAIGVVDVLLNIGVDGKPLDCTIIRSSGHQDLDSATCEKLLARGMFDPGLDHSGKPVQSPYFSSVVWMM